MRLVNECDVLNLHDVGAITVLQVLEKNRSRSAPALPPDLPTPFLDEPWNIQFRFAGRTLHAWAPGTTDVIDDTALIRVAGSINRLYRATSNHEKLKLEAIVSDARKRRY